MLAGLGANQDRRNIRVVTAFVEILKIQSVVNHLINVLHAKVAFSDLELKHKDNCANDRDGVDTTAHARNNELQIDRASVTRQCILKDCGLLQPCVPLICR